jgi:hypothetical protein
MDSHKSLVQAGDVRFDSAGESAREADPLASATGTAVVSGRNEEILVAGYLSLLFFGQAS